jgi:hypothetical protein
MRGGLLLFEDAGGLVADGHLGYTLTNHQRAAFIAGRLIIYLFYSPLNNKPNVAVSVGQNV